METYKFRPFEFKTLHPRGESKDGISVPIARSGHRITYYNQSIYSFGGYNPKISKDDYPDETWQMTHPLFQELWQFNLISGTWHRLENVDNGMPEELASHCAVGQGPSMLVYGGTAMPFGDSSSNAVHVCHLPSGRWQRIRTEGERPDPMYGQAICLSDDKLYVVGGTTGYEYSIDVHCLDLNTMVWDYLYPKILPQHYLPDERYRHEVIEHEGALYVFGGGRADATCDLSSIPTFLTNEREWTKTQTQPDRVTHNSPQKRRCHVACKKGSYVYVHGGYNGDEAYSDLWRLSLKTFEWQELNCQTESPLYFHSATITECGRMMVFGGVKNIDPSIRTPAVASVWLGIGRLRDICWDALSHYVPNLCNLPPSQLLQMGIPFSIVDALQQQQSPAG